MKKTVLSIVLLGLGLQSFAQDIIYETKIKKEELPVMVVTGVERDYPGFTMEEFTAVPLEYVESDVIIDKTAKAIDDYDTFEVTLEGKGKEITATYDRDGQLLTTMEHLKNITLSDAVRTSVAKTYPGWTIAKDVYNMKHYTGGKVRERYMMELTKGNEKMRVFTNGKGKILNNPKVRINHNMSK